MKGIKIKAKKVEIWDAFNNSRFKLQSDLAEEVGIEPETISGIMNSRIGTSKDTATKIMGALEIEKFSDIFLTVDAED